MSREHAQLLAATLDELRSPTDGAVPPARGTGRSSTRSSRPRSSARTVTRDAHGPLLTEYPAPDVGRRRGAGDQTARASTPAVRRTRLVDARGQAWIDAATSSLVTLDHTIEQDDTVVLTERQDVIYRDCQRRDARAG